jgi:hypothetical protein
VPFTVFADQFPAVTRADRATGRYSYGASNLLAATLQPDLTESDAAAVLSDDSPQAYTIEFGGLARNGEVINSRRSVGADRSPLVSLTAGESAHTIAALRAVDLAP